jgi:predicted amino acid racemase
MDFLDSLLRRNPALVRAAASLHRAGAIPPGTYVVDVDTVGANAGLLRKAIDAAGLGAYWEAKQFGRCPPLCQALVEAGFDAAIALDREEARALHGLGFRVGHVGHLGQPAQIDLEWLLGDVRPEVVTVYHPAFAEALATAARAVGTTVGVLLRPIGPGDLHNDLVGGGTPERDVPAIAARIAGLGGLRFEGITTYPALRYDVRERGFRPTPNLESLLRTRDALARAGLDARQVNAAGNACVASVHELADRGVTHVEPGQAFVAASPGHFFEDFPERPAVAFVSEVTHTDGDLAYALGTALVANHTIGIWNAVLYERLAACVGADPDTIAERLLFADPPRYGHSDPSSYLYLRLHQAADVRAAVGDTVVIGVRTQIYRANDACVAAVAGVSSGQPRLLGLYDRSGGPVSSIPAGRPAPGTGATALVRPAGDR